MLSLRNKVLPVVLCLAVAPALVACANDQSPDDVASLQQAEEELAAKGEPIVCPPPEQGPFKPISNEEAVSRLIELQAERQLATAALQFAGVEFDPKDGIGDFPGALASAAWACLEKDGTIADIVSFYTYDLVDSLEGRITVLDGACNQLATGHYSPTVVTLEIDLGVAAGLRCPKLEGLVYQATGRVSVTSTLEEKSVLVTTVALDDIKADVTYVTETFGSAKITASATVPAGTTKVATYELPAQCEGRTGPLCGKSNVLSMDSIDHDALVGAEVARRGPVGYLTAGLSDKGIALAAGAVFNHARKTNDPSWEGVVDLSETHADWSTIDEVMPELDGRLYDTPENTALRCALMSCE